jgi:hypothetical protein
MEMGIWLSFAKPSEFQGVGLLNTPKPHPLGKPLRENNPWMLLHVISEVIPNMKVTHKVLPPFENKFIPKEGN